MKRLFVALLAVTVCGPVAAQDIRVVSTDYAFRAVAQVRPGVHRVILVNHGRDVHHMVIARLTDSLDAQHAFQLIVDHKPAPPDVHDVGGPNAAAPGDSSSAWVDLGPGRYMISCWIVAPDGTLHVMKGMFGQIDCFVPDAKDGQSHFRHGMLREFDIP